MFHCHMFLGVIPTADQTQKSPVATSAALLYAPVVGTLRKWLKLWKSPQHLTCIVCTSFKATKKY